MEKVLKIGLILNMQKMLIKYKNLLLAFGVGLLIGPAKSNFGSACDFLIAAGSIGSIFVLYAAFKEQRKQNDITLNQANIGIIINTYEKIIACDNIGFNVTRMMIYIYGIMDELDGKFYTIIADCLNNIEVINCVFPFVKRDITAQQDGFFRSKDQKIQFRDLYLIVYAKFHPEAPMYHFAEYVRNFRVLDDKELEYAKKIGYFVRKYNLNTSGNEFNNALSEYDDAFKNKMRDMFFCKL